MPTPRPPVGGSEEVRAEGSVSRNTKAVSGWSFIEAARAMAMRAKCVDANPCRAGRLLPNDGRAEIVAATLTTSP